MCVIALLRPCETTWIFENGAVPAQFTCVIYYEPHNVLRSIVSYFSCNQTTYFTLFVQYEGCSYLKIVACRSGWACSSSNSCIWLLHAHSFSQYTLLTCSVLIWLMKCSSSSCIWHYVYTASLSIHSINLKCVHLAHEISHLKGKLVLNVVVLNSFDLKLFSFHSTLI